MLWLSLVGCIAGSNRILAVARSDFCSATIPPRLIIVRTTEFEIVKFSVLKARKRLDGDFSWPKMYKAALATLFPMLGERK